MTCRWIHKVGLAAIDSGRLLVVRKHGSDVFILPGGKPEGSETDLQTLAREVDEELGCRIERPLLRGVFKDVAAGISDAVVVVRLYSAELVGELRAQAEIEELAWVDMKAPGDVALAPSIENHILPYLLKRSRLRAGSASQKGGEPAQGLLKIV